MSFTNDYLQEARQKLTPSLTFFATPGSSSSDTPRPKFPMEFTEYASLVSILYNNKNKLETVCSQMREELSATSTSKSAFIFRQPSTLMGTKPHTLAPTSFTTPSWCMFCGEFIWGLGRVGYRCLSEDCNCYIHKECKIRLPNNCGSTFYSMASETAADPLHVLVGNFFFLLQQAYHLITHGKPVHLL